MTYKEQIEAIREGKPLTTRRCLDCGAESVLWFGFEWGCRRNGGSHQTLIDVETDVAHEAHKLQATYSCAMWYDREKFDKSFPEDLRKTLFLIK